MGSLIEINDTLKISKDRGFPKDMNLEMHIREPRWTRDTFLGREFEFWNNDERLYHRPPTRVFLVEEMENGEWLYWGNALIVSQIIEQGKTKGKYRIVKIYQPEFQKRITIEESPIGKSYFKDERESFLLS